MKIVHLENHVSNFDGIDDTSRWKELGEYIRYERTPQELVVERAKDAEVLFINKSQISENELKELPKLKYIGVFATGWNVVDVLATKKRGICVTNVPAYSTDSVAQFVFALLFKVFREVDLHSKYNWSEALDFSNALSPQLELTNLTMGLIGFGAIARKVAQIALAFNMKVVTYTRTPSKVNLHGVEVCSLDELLRKSDVVSLHCPLTTENSEMINATSFEKMKKTSVLINTARGGLINELDLCNALKNQKIMAAALDVLSVEPPPKEHPLLNLPNCVITPHIAWASSDARKRLIEQAYQNLLHYLNGIPINKVN